jgi:hypothetical protein
VTSRAVLLAAFESPPPETVAWLVRVDLTLGATPTTTTIIAGYEALAASALQRLQEFTVQVQSCPYKDMTASPAIAFSVIATEPAVGAESTLVTRKRL